MLGSSYKNHNNPLTGLEPLTVIPGIGEKIAAKCASLKLHCLNDCLSYFPTKYEDRSRITPIATLISGQSALIHGKIIKTQQIPRPRPRLKVWLEDASGLCVLNFFQYNKQSMARFQIGDFWSCFGSPYLKQNTWQMAHPDSTLKPIDEPLNLSDTLLPIYPTVAGLSQKTLQKIIHYAVQRLAQQIPELLPPSMASTFTYTVSEAIRWIHQPSLETSIDTLLDRSHPAMVRLITEELLAHQLIAQEKRTQLRLEAAIACQTQTSYHAQFLAQLPFELTTAQERVWQEIRKDLKTSTPLVRLLQGDVGSGKTVVAALTLFSAIGTGKQAALMVPTEVLALQHYELFTAWGKTLGITVQFLGGVQTPASRRAALENIAEGRAQLIIGTHALFQESVQFQSLACIVIDEQHRFGVHQRWALLEKGRAAGSVPHQLIMTATPIPRTLAMAAYGEMDVSTIDELPKGRQPITTSLISDTKRSIVMDKLEQWCQQGAQSYWICPLIEESEQLQCQAAEKTVAELQERLPSLRIALIHGRLSADEKQRIMQAFQAHQYDVLVATTVIEVGIDVPNASLIVIDNPDRLGLAQLHQLRGRVGRGAAASHCLLICPANLSLQASARLKILKDSQDGFVIAEKDFEHRGPGEWLGTKQSGLATYKIAQLPRDAKLLAKAHAIALASKETWNFKPMIVRWLAEKPQYHQV